MSNWRAVVTRRARHRRIRASWARRYPIGPYSWLNRLRDAALDGHVCRPYVVYLKPEEAL